MTLKFEHSFKLPNGKWVFVPTIECRDIGYQIIAEVSARWEAPSYYYHFQKGGHVAALKAHESSTFFARADIKGFFSSVTNNKIISSLKKIGIYYTRAKEIAEASTILSRDTPRKHVLPFGFVQSSLLASIALNNSALGIYLANTFPDVIKTVYADDIILSSNDETKVGEIYSVLQRKFHYSSFILNAEKSHAAQRKTHAFNVEMFQNSLQIEEKKFDKFIDEMRFENTARAVSIASYVRTINPTQSDFLLDTLNSQ